MQQNRWRIGEQGKGTIQGRKKECSQVEYMVKYVPFSLAYCIFSLARYVLALCSWFLYDHPLRDFFPPTML